MRGIPVVFRVLNANPTIRDGPKIRSRGVLKKDYYADVVIFDPQTVRNHATFAGPHQYSTGVHHVFVNGVLVLMDGEHTGTTPG